MILPVIAYGHPVLKKEAKDITKDYADLQQLIENMWETMYAAKGIGLAAPQIGLSIRLFVADTVQLQEEGEEDKGIKKVFINATILEEEGEEWGYEEGCLSIPDVNGEVYRQEKVTIEYYNENFELVTETFDGMNARVIQHEYDHIDGILFTEYLKPLKRRLIKRKLEKIRTGKIHPRYRMKFYTPRR